MAISGISSSSSLKDIQQSTAGKKNTSDKSESSTTSKYDKYVKGEDSEDSGIYSSQKVKSVDEDGYRYRTRQEKKALKAKKSRAFSFGGLYNCTPAAILERLNTKSKG